MQSNPLSIPEVLFMVHDYLPPRYHDTFAEVCTRWESVHASAWDNMTVEDFTRKMVAVKDRKCVRAITEHMRDLNNTEYNEILAMFVDRYVAQDCTDATPLYFLWCEACDEFHDSVHLGRVVENCIAKRRWGILHTIYGPAYDYPEDIRDKLKVAYCEATTVEDQRQVRGLVRVGVVEVMTVLHAHDDPTLAIDALQAISVRLFANKDYRTSQRLLFFIVSSADVTLAQKAIAAKYLSRCMVTHTVHQTLGLWGATYLRTLVEEDMFDCIELLGRSTPVLVRYMLLIVLILFGVRFNKQRLVTHEDLGLRKSKVDAIRRMRLQEGLPVVPMVEL